jgi:hypothetical protein
MPRIVCSAATTGASSQSGNRFDLCGQSIAPGRGSLDRLNVILEHDMMHRLFKAQTCEPPAMQLGPGRPPVMATLAQQKPRELLAGPAQRMHRVETCPHQIADRLMRRIRNPHSAQLSRPMQPRQTGRIPPICLDPVARPLWNQGGGDNNAVVPVPRQLALDAVTTRPGFVAQPQLHPLLAELANQPVQSRRRVGDPAVVANLTPQAAFRYRHGDPVLVNIKPDIRDTIPHDPSPMHEARHRPIRRNPRYLHTVRRVAPSSGGHVV